MRDAVLAVVRELAKPGAPDQWVPVRHMYRDAVCAFCWCDIPAGVPGRTTGTRGTRAWMLKGRSGVFECCPCRSEAMERDERTEKNRQGVSGGRR